LEIKIDNKMKLNPSIIVINNHNNLILIKIGNTDKIIKMSSIEFNIITNYSKVLDINLVIENFKNEIKIETSQMVLLIEKATENKILITNDSLINNNSSINFIFKKNKKIFEVLNLDFTNTALERFFENRIITNCITVLFAILFSFFIYNILSEPLNFKENYLKTLYKVPISFSTIIGYIYLASFISTLIHEFGHYFIYKTNAGKTSVFGFGLLFFFIPVFFNKVLVSLIQKKERRIFINAGGMLFDFLQFVFLIYFTKTFHDIYPILSFFCYTLMISITIRTFFNLNIFLPSTDGYFIFTDLLNKPNFFEIALQNTKKILKNGERTNFKNYCYALYIIICYFFFSVSWCLFFLPILMYLYYANF
jgi:hypothetical protein